MTENSQDASQVTGSVVQAPNYSEFETLYESVLFKKPELVTGKVFVNTMNELKVNFKTCKKVQLVPNFF